MDEDDDDGCRFNPTDEEKLIFLFYKMIGVKVKAHDFIGTCDLYGDKEPWEILGEAEESELYLFTRLKKVGKKKSGCEYKRFSRSVGEGTWSNKGKTVSIYRQRKGGGVIGYKKCFRYQPKIEGGGDGIWLLKEYSLPENCFAAAVKEEYKDCVLCVLKRKGEGRPDLDQGSHAAEENIPDDQDQDQGAWTTETNAQEADHQEELTITDAGDLVAWTDGLFPNMDQENLPLTALTDTFFDGADDMAMDYGLSFTDQDFLDVLWLDGFRGTLAPCN